MPLGGIYPINKIKLLEQIKLLGKSFEFINQEQLIAQLNTNEMDQVAKCVITFDDGLKEQMKAVTFLESLNVPVICYAPTLPLVEEKVLYVHKLHMLRSKVNDVLMAKKLARSFDFDCYEFDVDLLKIQYRYDSDISRKVKYYLNFVLNTDSRNNWVDKEFSSEFGSEAVASRALYMSKTDIKYLASKNLLGTHCHAHVPLAQLSHEEMECDIGASIDILEGITNTRMLGLSYPFGGKSAVSNSVFDVAKNLGLEYGFTMERGINCFKSSENAINTMSLMRIDTNDVTQTLGTLS